MIETATKARRTLLAVAAALVLAVGLVGLTACGGSSSSSSSAASGSGSAAASGSASSASYDTSAYENLDSVEMIFGANVPSGGISDQWIRAVAQNVSDRTGGKFTMQVLSLGELGGNADIMRQTQSNDVQLYYTEPATLTSFIPELAVFDAPMLFNDYSADQIESVLNGDNEFTQELNKGFEKAGVKNLMWLQDGTYREVTSNKELRTLADYKGFQIRTMENSYHMEFWEAVGAEPTPLTFAEVYFALQNGTVDGQENALFTSVSNNFQEVQKYVEFTNHILYSGEIVMNLDAWNGLDPAYQDALMAAVKETHDTMRPKVAEQDKADLKTMEDAGMEAIYYDDAFFDEFKNKDGVKKVYQEISDATDGLLDTLQDQLKAAA